MTVVKLSLKEIENLALEVISKNGCDTENAGALTRTVVNAERDGFSVPLGTGLDEDGNETTDPAAILKGVLLPFGGYKGSVVATMVELLAAGATGEGFSFETKKADNGDGGPPRGGEFFLAFSPTLLAEEGWEDHCEKFFDKYESIPGARLPDARRHNNRNDTADRSIDSNLVATIKELL